ncbi:hypothetical protein CR513_03098, partial [Mucuna pruriens]
MRKSSRPDKADSSKLTPWPTSSQEPTPVQNRIHPGSRRPTPPKARSKHVEWESRFIVSGNSVRSGTHFLCAKSDRETEPEDDASEEGSALILARPFFMTAKTKIDVHAGTILMEFGDTYVEFNIFEALKHPAEDHSTFDIDTIDELMEEYSRLGTGSASLIGKVQKTSRYAELLIANISKLGVRGVATLINAKPDSRIRFRKADRAEFDSKGRRMAETDSSIQEIVRTESINSDGAETSDRVSQPTPSTQEKNISPQPQTTELKPLHEHLKYAYLGITSNFWINPSICMHKILLEENARPPGSFIPFRIANGTSRTRWCQLGFKIVGEFALTIGSQIKQLTRTTFRYCLLTKLYADSYSTYGYKTTFTCSFGMFAYTRMPFKLYNAPSTF